MTIPESVTTIETWAFNHCGLLTSIEIPRNVKTWGKEAFSYSGLERVVISDGVATIRREAFMCCEK